ncbi:hypothetical protein [Devosia sp. LjRoot3]|uniref:hypothetical protein n=1 Tax=Devosia sp. LjRoot3 TaxID=3342319 RepID=UPI003ECCA3FF
MADHLVGRVWHTTHPSRLAAISAAGALLVEPPISNSERWKTTRGPDYFPFVRHLGGVSLFDFDGFDGDAYDEKYVMSSWRTFVPCRRDWASALWIEFDRDAIADKLVAPPQLLDRWKATASYRYTIMPGIEAGYLGDLSLCAARSILVVSSAGDQVSHLDLSRFEHGDLAH